MKKIISVLLAALLTISMSIAAVSTTAAASSDVIYFEKPTSWGTPNCYVWGGTSGANSAWPGAAMTLVTGSVYSYTVPGDQVNVIFNCGGSQTADLSLTGNAGKIFTITSGNSGTWSTYDSPVVPTSPTSPSSPTSPTTVTDPQPSGTGATAVLANTANWSSPTVYYWNGSTKNNAWPGVALTENDKDAAGNYVVDIPQAYIGSSDAGVIFSNSGSSQSADLKIAAGDCKIYDNSNSSWVDYDTSAVKLSLTSSVATPQYTDTDITFSAAASGGSGSYTYRFSVNDKVVQEYSTANTYAWNSQTAGNYVIKVEVLDTQGNSNSKTMNYEIKDDTLAVEPVLKGITTTASGSSTEVVKGQSTDVKVRAAGGHTGTNLIFYKIAIYDPNGTAVNTIYYKTSNSLNFTPSQLGTYKVEVTVQNSANTTKTSTYNLESVGSIVTTPTVDSFGANLASPQNAGTDITLSASASGGTAPYQYQFTANGTVIQSYSTAATCKWTPDSAATYTLGVTVKDNAGQVSSTRTMSYTIASVEYILGDANADGNVNLRDCIYLQRAVASIGGLSIDNLTASQKKASDMNGDGVVNLRDIIVLQKKIANIL